MRAVSAGSLVGALVGTVAFTTPPAHAQDESNLMMSMIIETFEYLEQVEGQEYFAVSDPSVPDVGDPIEVRSVASATFDFGRPLTQEELVLGHGFGIDTVNEGNADIGRGQNSWTMVIGEFDRPPRLTDNEISNISLAYRYAGQPGLEGSPFANDPLDGMSIVIDDGVAQGERFRSYQQYINGWQLFADQIPAFEFYMEQPGPQGFRRSAEPTIRSYFRVYLFPGVAEIIKFVPSHAFTAVAEALYASVVEVAQRILPPPDEDVPEWEPGSSLITVDQFADGEAFPGWCLGEYDPADRICSVPEVPAAACTASGGEVGDGVCNYAGPLETCEMIGFETAGGVCVPFGEPFTTAACASLGEPVGGACIFPLDANQCASSGAVPVDEGYCVATFEPDADTCDSWDGYEWVGSVCQPASGDVAPQSICQPWGESTEDGGCSASGLPAGACQLAGGTAEGDVCSFSSAVTGDACLVLGLDAGETMCLPAEPPFPADDCGRIGTPYGDACLVLVEAGSCTGTGSVALGDTECVVFDPPDESVCSEWGSGFTYGAGGCASTDATEGAVGTPPESETLTDGVPDDDRGTGGSLMSILLVGLAGLIIAVLTGWWFWWRPKHSGDATATDTSTTATPTETPPPTREAREAIVFANRGEITTFMNEWGLAADIAIGEVFGVRGLVGRWRFFASDPFLVGPDEDIPDGATVLYELPDGEGTIVTVQGAHREYRIGADGSFLGSFITDPTPATSVFAVKFAHDEVSLNIPTAWGFVYDVESRQLFTAASSRPSQDAVDAVLAEHGGEIYVDDDLEEPLPEWQALQPASGSEALRIMAERVKEGGVVMEHPGEPPALLAGRPVFMPVVLLGAAMAATEHAEGAHADPSQRFTGDDYVPKYFMENDWFLPGAERFGKMLFFDNIAQNAVDAALAAGATPNADGWVPVTGAQYYGAALIPKPAAVAQPRTAGHGGIFINVETLETLMPWSTGAPGSAHFDLWAGLMGEQGLDPFVRNGGHVLAAFEDVGYVFMYDHEGRPYQWYRPGDADRPATGGPMDDPSAVPEDARRVWEMMYDNIELNEATMATSIGDMVICM